MNFHSVEDSGWIDVDDVAALAETKLISTSAVSMGKRP
jgi:hypothetical protein